MLCEPFCITAAYFNNIIANFYATQLWKIKGISIENKRGDFDVITSANELIQTLATFTGESLVIVNPKN